MDIEPVRVWLKRTLNGAMLRSVLGSVGSLLAGLLVLYVPFVLAFCFFQCPPGQTLLRELRTELSQLLS